jgi:hypothetical protein
VKKETPKPREEAFVCMFCSHASHLDECCFLSLNLSMLIWICFSANLAFVFFIPLEILLVSFLTLVKLFRLISHLLNLL